MVMSMMHLLIQVDVQSSSSQRANPMCQPHVPTQCAGLAGLTGLTGLADLAGLAVLELTSRPMCQPHRPTQRPIQRTVVSLRDNVRQ